MVWECIVLLCPEMWINRVHSETQTNKAAMDGYVLYGGARFDGTLAARRQCGVLRHILVNLPLLRFFRGERWLEHARRAVDLADAEFVQHILYLRWPREPTSALRSRPHRRELVLLAYFYQVTSAGE